ncbi:MAG: HD domain-containing protein [archaeon]
MENKKIKIGIDIDDVVLEFYERFANFCNENHGSSIGCVDLGSNFINSLGSKEKTLTALKNFVDEGHAYNLVFIEGFKEIFDDLNKDFDLCLITSRSYDNREQTKTYFKDNIPNFDLDIHYTFDYPECKKSVVCNTIGASIIVEDDSYNALECAQNGIKVFLMDKPWNQNCEHDNIVRVKDWKEIIEKLRTQEQEINIIEEVRKFVEEECSKNKLGEEILVNHILHVVEGSKKLAKKLNADSEIVEIASWLHDIGSIIHGRENHHITGAKIAEEKLIELGYPLEKIEQIKKCILNHRGSIGNNVESIEEKIIIEADSLPCFDHLEGQFLWVIERDGVKNQQELRKIVRQKLINKYNQLSLEGKELIKPKYEAAMLLLS